MPSSHIQVAWLWEFDLASSVGPACEVTLAKRRVFPLFCPFLEGLTKLLQTPAFQHFGEGGFGLVRHGPELVSSLEMIFNF